MNIPKDAEYYYQHTYYKKGTEHYAMYYQKGWRASATLSNETLTAKGVPINVQPLPNTTY